MSTPKPRGGDSPRPVRVLRVLEDQSHVVRFLAGYAGCLLHFHGKHYHPCLGPVDCPLVLHKAKSLWRGWAPILHWEELTQLWWPMVLEITESLEEALRGRQLRGESWALTRPRTKAVGSPVLGIYLERVNAAELPKPFDIRPILQRVYHSPGIELGTPNPMPPKTVLGPIEGPLPEVWASAMEEGKQPEERMSSEEFRKRLAGIGIKLDQGSHRNGQAKREGGSNG